MPTYTVTNPAGQTLKITGDKPPSEEELNTIFAEYNQRQKLATKQEEPVKLTEETIVQDPNWISASKSVYEMNEGEDAPKLTSDEEYAKYGLNYMGWFNYNLPKMGLEATQLKEASPEQQQDFITLMDMYDEKSASFAGFGRALKGIVSDPSTYVGLSTLGAGTLGAQALKQGIKQGVKEAVKVGAKRGAAIGSLEGATYAAADNAFRQQARINAGVQDNFDLSQSAKSAAIGAGIGAPLGGVLGGVVAGVASRNTKRLVDDALQKEEPSITNPEKTVDDVEVESKGVYENQAQEIENPVTQPNVETEPTLASRIKDINEPVEDITTPQAPVEDSALGKLFPPYAKVANQTINYFNEKLASYSPLGTLPDQEQFLLLKGLLGGKFNQIRKVTRDTFDKFSKLSKDENSIVRQSLLGERNIDDIPDEELKTLTKDLRESIDFIGDSLVKKGILPEDVVAEKQGTYLPRMYLKYLDTKKTPMGYTKTKQELDDETLEFLGEIEDVSLQGAKAIEEPLSDIVRHGVFEKIAENPNWVFRPAITEWKGKKVTSTWLKDEANRINQEIDIGRRKPKSKYKKLAKKLNELAYQTDANIKNVDTTLYKQIPDTKEYGTLRGAYIRKEIYNDMISAGDFVNPNAGFMQSILGDYGTLTKATKLWKLSKVPLNPPTVVRNMISNTILLNLSGVAWRNMPRRYIQALDDMRNNGPYTKIAEKYGIVDSTFTKQEMIQINRMYLKAKKEQTGNFIDQMKYIGGVVGDTASNVYQFTEVLGKVVKIIDDTAKGIPEPTAALNAQKTLFDYSLVPEAVRFLRNSPIGMPFITYYYKVLPNLLEAFIKNPQRYIPYIAIPYGMHSLIANYKGVSNEDFNKLKETLPEYLKDRDNALILPVKDDQGRWQVLDFSYFMPYAMFTGTARDVAEGNFGRFVQDTGIFGGPLPQLTTAILSNKDPFTQRQIVNEFDPPEKKTADMMLYLYRMSAPTWLTDIGFAGKLYEAVNEDLNKYGDPKITKTQALSRLVGFNIYPIDPELSRAENLRRMKYEISRIKSRRNQLLKDRNLTEEEKQKIVQKYTDQILDRNKQLQEYIKASQVPEELK